MGKNFVLVRCLKVHSEYTELCAARAEEEQLVSQCGEHTAVSNQLLTVVTVVFIVQYWWYLSNCSKSVHCVGYSLIRSLLSLQGGDEHSTAWHCGKPVASYSSQTSRQVQHLKGWCFGWSRQRFLTYSVTCCQIHWCCWCVWGGTDTGGPRRDFLTLLMKQLKDWPIFDGPEGHLFSVYSADGMCNLCYDVITEHRLVIINTNSWTSNRRLSL